MFTYSFIAGDLAVFQCLSVILAAALMPTMITANSPAEILCIRVLSPSRRSLGDTSNVFPCQLLRYYSYSGIILQTDWIIWHSGMQWKKFPISLWYFQHRLLFITLILPSLKSVEQNLCVPLYLVNFPLASVTYFRLLDIIVSHPLSLIAHHRTFCHSPYKLLQWSASSWLIDL